MQKELIPSQSSLMSKWPLRRMGFSRDFFRDYDKLMDSFLRSWPSEMATEEYLSPRVDISENDKSIEVLADLPGVDEKEIRVELRNGTLWISGEKKDSRKEQSKNLVRSERYYGSFERGITLPCDVERGKIEAVYKDGELRVTLPKTAEAREEITQIKVKH